MMARVKTLASWSAAIKPELDRLREEWNNLPPGPIGQIKAKDEGEDTVGRIRTKEPPDGH